MGNRHCSMQISSKCKKEKGNRDEKNFYVTINDNIYKSDRIHICKDCIKEYVYENEKIDLNKLKKILRVIDFPFLKQEYESAVNSKVETVGSYMKNIYLNHRGKSWDEGEQDKLTDLLQENENMDEEMIRFWGKGFSADEIEFLENEFANLTSRFECDSYSQEMLFQEIAHQRLDIKKKRANGSSVDKELKTLQDLLGSANIKPVQETGANATEQATFGVLIKKYENERPIPEPLDDWKQKDWIKKYVLVWFFGHLCKMLNVQNQYSMLYEEEIMKYTVDNPIEENEEDIIESEIDVVEEENTVEG